MMGQSAAEEVAVKALAWIAGDQDLAGAFLGASGAAAEDLRDRAADPDFLGFVLDFLLMDEAALVAFCEAAGLPPETPMQARQALPGGDSPDFT